MKVQKFAQSTIIVRTEETSVLVDPGKYNDDRREVIAAEWTNVDAVVVTHRHPDHFDPGLARWVHDACSPRWLVNLDLAPEFAALGLPCETGTVGSEFEIGNMRIQFVLSEHFARGEVVPDVGCLIRTAESTVYHASDTHILEPDRVSAAASGADLMLVPISDRGLVMSIDDALFMVNAFKPKRVVPIHYDSPKDSKRIIPEDFVSRSRQLVTTLPHLGEVDIQVLGFGETIQV